MQRNPLLSSCGVAQQRSVAESIAIAFHVDGVEYSSVYDMPLKTFQLDTAGHSIAPIKKKHTFTHTHSVQREKNTMSNIMLLKHLGKACVYFCPASLFCLYSKRDVFMRLSQISVSGFIVNFLWHFVCLLSFFSLCLSFSSLSSDYYDDYCCVCVCSFQFSSFAAQRFHTQQILYVLFEKFMNRITINLSTSTPSKSTWSAFKATATNGHTKYNEYLN